MKVLKDVKGLRGAFPNVVKCREGYDTAQECERREGGSREGVLDRCDVATRVDDPLVL